MNKVANPLFKMFKDHMSNIAAMNKKVADFSKIPDKDSTKNKIQVLEKAMQTKIDLNLPFLSWSKLFSTDDVSQIFESRRFSNEHAISLLEYPFLNEISEEEWEEINDSFLARLVTTENLIPDFLKEWSVPLTFMSTKDTVSDDTYTSMVEQFSKSHGADYYGKERAPWINHGIAKLSIQLFFQLRWNLKKINHRTEEVSKKSTNPEEVLKIMIKLLETPKLNMEDKENLVDGFMLLVKASLESLNALIANRKDTVVADIIEIGKTIRVDVPEKVVKRLANSTASVMEVLFGSHRELVEKQLARFEDLGGKYISYNSPKFDTVYKQSRVLKVLQRAAFDNKKVFLDLMKDFLETKPVFTSECSLLSERFYHLVNVNTLNKKHVESAAQIKLRENHFNSIESPITFQEFEFLNDANELHRALFFKLGDMKIDRKIRLLNSIPEFEWNEQYRISYDEFVERLVVAVENKGFHQYTELMKGKELSKRGALILHVLKDVFEPIMSDIQSDMDVDLLLKHQLGVGENILSLKDRVYRSLDEIDEFKKFLKSSDEFIKNNLNSFYDFYERGLVKVCSDYKGALNSQQKENLRLLAKAEIAGKLKEIKYRDDDFEKEIGCYVSPKQKDLWKTDSSKELGKYVISETSDFNHLIRMGEIPTRTCMDWSGGSYRHCLLSIFDANKSATRSQPKYRLRQLSCA